MKQQEALNNIKKFLGRFENEVSFSNSNNEYDINIHSENVLIPILNLVFGLKLINLNYETKNIKTIDLGDKSNAIAFQITSENTSTKIKETISSFKDDIGSSDFKTCKILILGKKKNYRDKTKEYISKKTGEDFEKSVFDLHDLYRLIALLDLNLILQIEKILSDQFLDSIANMKLKSRNDFSIVSLDIVDADSTIVNQRYFLKEGQNPFFCQAKYTDGHIERYNPYWLAWSQSAIRTDDPSIHFGKQKQESIIITCKPNHEMYFEISCWVFPPSKQGSDYKNPGKGIALIYPNNYPPMSKCSVSAFLQSSKTNPKIEVWNRGSEPVKEFEIKVDGKKRYNFYDEKESEQKIDVEFTSMKKVFIKDIPIKRSIKVETKYTCCESGITHSGTQNLINYAIN